MLEKPLSICAVAAVALALAISTADATEFRKSPVQHEEKCQFVTDLVEEFQESLDDKVEPISLNSPWSKTLARDVAKTDRLAAYLTDIGVDVYSEEQLLNLDLRNDRVSVFILNGGRIQVSCG